MPAKSHTEQDKGRQVRIVGGLYEGRTGWIHLSANTFDTKKWIIVTASTTQPEKARLIMNDNISYQVVASPPQRFEEALLMEHKDIAKDMRKIAKKLAEFDGYMPNAQMISIFFNMWKEERAKRDSASRVQGARAVRTLSPPNQASSFDMDIFEAADTSTNTSTNTSPSSASDSPNIIPA